MQKKPFERVFQTRVRLWVRAGANQCRLAMLSLPKFGAPSGFENPGVKKTDRNKIREISSAPLTEQTIVVVALFPFAARGWVQKKPFERVFQTLRASFWPF